MKTTLTGLLISRGVIPTPEQFVPGEMIDEVWESNMTMGSQWHYKPTNDHYKSGTELINMLIEARAKGGSYLLNIGPGPYGELNEGQRGRLMEIAAWNFVNNEGIQKVRPWIITNEGPIWFTKKKDENTVFAYLAGISDWPRGQRREFLIRSVKSTGQSRVSVLGQSGNLVEYQPNPIVIKLENVEPALKPAVFLTEAAQALDATTVRFSINLKDQGDGKTFRAGFEYRPLQSTLNEEFNEDWTRTDLFSISETGLHALEVRDEAFRSIPEIEFRAVLYQGDPKIEGNLKRLRLGGKECDTGLPKK